MQIRQTQNSSLDPKSHQDSLETGPGARFSKDQVTLRARNQIFKSKYKEEEHVSWLANYSILFH